MNGTTRRITTTILAGAVALVSEVQPAQALQGGEDPALLPVLIDKRFGQDGRHQLSALFSTAMATKFVEATGGLLTYGYNFTDLLGIEVAGGFFLGSEAAITSEVRRQTVGGEPKLSDLYQLQWMAQVNLMFVPIYGKISFASEIDPGYDIFLIAGAGVAGLRREITDPTAAPGLPSNPISPVFDFGLGLRFYITKLIALRLELRDYFYLEQDDTNGGLTFNLHFQGGVQFAFGGE